MVTAVYSDLNGFPIEIMNLTFVRAQKELWDPPLHKYCRTSWWKWLGMVLNHRKWFWKTFELEIWSSELGQNFVLARDTVTLGSSRDFFHPLNHGSKWGFTTTRHLGFYFFQKTIVPPKIRFAGFYSWIHSLVFICYQCYGWFLDFVSCFCFVFLGFCWFLPSFCSVSTCVWFFGSE